jgi:uncharacterized protein (DUF302 family)
MLDVGVMLPCNVVVYEGDDGKAVVVAVDPMQTIAGGEPALVEIATLVKAKLTKVLDSLV